MSEVHVKAKARLADWLSRRFFVRFHFSLILGIAFGIGLLTTKAFLALGLETMHWRWPIALLASYLGFLLCVRLWLSYVGLGRYLDDGLGRHLDFPDLAISNSGGSSGGSGGLSLENVLPRIPGGGQFGGGGASADFSLPADSAPSGIASSLGDTVKEAVGGSSDEGCLVLLAILALLAAIFGVGIYVIWQAPALLAEVAFEGALAAGLVKPLRRIEDPGWIGGALRASAIPFLLIFACTMAIAFLAESHAPEASTLVEAIRILLQ